jgi:hypothetical protein
LHNLLSTEKTGIHPSTQTIQFAIANYKTKAGLFYGIPFSVMPATKKEVLRQTLLS